ncbi:MAG: mechanosensitive ion channel domain-containing protein, partial [Pseudomonadota bacterium]
PLVVNALYLAGRERRASKAWFAKPMNQIRLLLVAVCTTVALAVLTGHVYSVMVVFSALVYTACTGSGLFLLYCLLMRWLTVTRRRLRMQELVEARTDTGDGDDNLTEEPTANLGDLSEETSQLIRVGIFAVAAVLLMYIWLPLLPAFDLFSRVTLWTSSAVVDGQTSENRITLATLLVVLFLAGLTLYAARKLPALIDLVLRSRTQVSPSARYTTSSLVNYVILGGGIVAALAALGVQWSQLQWLVAALGVGIGFGLQEIIANFISGIIILFERPIRVGDVVSTGGTDGVVTKIRIRATTIVDWDGKELLVPNKEFITDRLLNWSLSDPKIRIVLRVGIAYGANVELAIKSLHEIVSAHPRVVEDPKPQVVFEEFGDNALLLSARCHLDSLDDRLGVVTALNREIYRRFAELDIVIAFPQRDVHIDAENPIRVTLENP